MGKRGPRPKGAENIRVLDAPTERRPNPLPGMTQPARAIWKRIVNQYVPDHFRPQHYDQLRAYCESAAIYKAMVKDLSTEGFTIENPKTGIVKENPKVGTMDKMAGRMQGLAVKLGITKNATINTREPDNGQEQKPKSKRAGLMFNG